jgi:hypothetical protein
METKISFLKICVASAFLEMPVTVKKTSLKRMLFEVE